MSKVTDRKRRMETLRKILHCSVLSEDGATHAVDSKVSEEEKQYAGNLIAEKLGDTK